jgi:hypothetical protein
MTMAKMSRKFRIFPIPKNFKSKKKIIARENNNPL